MHRRYFFLLLLFINVSLNAQFGEPEKFNGWEGETTTRIHIGDFDLDGQGDAIGINSNRAYYIRENGDHELLFNLFGQSIEGSIVVDFDLDGGLEIVVFVKSGNAISAEIYERENGQFILKERLDNILSLQDNPTFFTTNPKNNERPEIICASGNTIGRVRHIGEFYAFTFIPGPLFGNFGNVTSVQEIDYNNDGLLDLFWITQEMFFFESFVSVRTLTDFELPIPKNLSDENFSTIGTIPLMNGPGFSLDLDNDGDVDFLTTAYQTQSIHWFENISQTEIAPPKLLNVNFTIDTQGEFIPNNLIPYDIDGDGFMDFITSTNKGISWHRNNGNATFDEIVVAEDIRPLGLDIGRIDENEAPDIVYSTLDPIILDIYKSLNSTNAPQSAFVVNSIDDCSAIKPFRNKSISYYPDSDITWDFGNGNSSNEIHPIFEYEESGLYEVSLEVCNNFGCDTSYQEIVTVSPQVFIPDTIPLGIPFNFVDETLFMENRTWSFGDGNISTEQSVEHSYSFPGIYLLQLFLNSSIPAICQFVIEKEIVVPPILEDDDGLIVFPNPMTDHCQVIFDNEDGKTYRIQIFNNLGQVVFDDQSADSFFYSFDNQILREGIYHIHLTLNSVFIDTKKIVVVEP